MLDVQQINQQLVRSEWRLAGTGKCIQILMQIPVVVFDSRGHVKPGAYRKRKFINSFQQLLG